MYKIVFYAPQSAVEQVKTAMFDAGAGKIGHYSHCAWQVLGEGQFKPLDSSNPTLGAINQIESLPEFKVELVCADQSIKEVMKALKTAHPYESPAYQVVKCEDF